jgi:glycosyltransferase involved in cell wall biosynthesis
MGEMRAGTSRRDRKPMQRIKTALVHDWLVSQGGGEAVLKGIYEQFPGPIFTLFKQEHFLDRYFGEDLDVKPSFLQKIPGITKRYRYFLPLYPLAIEQFDLSEYPLVLSSSHAVAKGVLTHSEQLHICYCSSPMRYVWDLYYDHLNALSGAKKIAMHLISHTLRKWDLLSSNRVDHFIANSHYIAKRIKKVYGRESTVIYPPVDTEKFALLRKSEEYYITVSRLVPYKRIDLLITAFSQMREKKLLIIGEGPELKTLKAKATKNIEFLGFKKDEELLSYFSCAKAFLFAAKEDFGIAPVEAQAAGIPVIAYGKGGALETIISEKTGIFFDEQNPKSLIDAVNQFEKAAFDCELIKEHAAQFSKERFAKEYKDFVEKKLEAFL